MTAALPVQAQNITSIGGNSSWGLVYNVSVDAAGNLYAADSTKHVVYKVDSLGATTVIAGTGTAGYSGDGALATSAQLRQPLGTAVAPDGTVYIADYGNERIRKVAPNGIITTLAGSTSGFSGDGGPATSAKLNGPASLVLDPAGNLFVSEISNFRIRKISAGGTITTVAGTGRCPFQSGDGGLATSADACPLWLALGPDGSLYFTDDGDGRFYGFSRIRRVALNGTISTVAGTGASGFTGDGGPATAAQIRSASGLAVDSGGNIYISDALDSRIRKVNTSGVINTYAGTGTAGSAGDGGPAVRAQVNWPTGMTMDAGGNLIFIDRNSFKIRKISPPPVPAIRASNPVVTAFLGNAGFSSNTYVEIYGSNFATVSRLWAGSDFSGSSAPTSLDGVSVTVNGKSAFVYYISPGQININTPEDTATGLVQIQVKTSLGISNVVTANRVRLSPTLQSVAQFNVGGKQYVVALTPDFATYIGRPNMLPGVPFIAARPGDTVAIYALGCGATSPPTQAGVVAAQGSPMALPYQVKIGGVPAQVLFAGMVSGSIGLYQFNVVIPIVPGGDQPIELMVDGVANGQNLVIAIGE
ncbi:MAG TPA: IPT/TIG domain-containing protein [Bryobacteraceae bacterium]|nr:IPT/TIG domain-containing protein [Bryobacteraceae bacterium]